MLIRTGINSVGNEIECGVRHAIGQRLPDQLRFEFRNAYGRIIDTPKSYRGFGADRAVEGQLRGYGNYGEVTVALADLMEAGSSRHAGSNYRQVDSNQ